ncbi:MAG: glycosyltransferase family 4 protein [Ignavibacteria bacterium]|nr:glycosyltransferase family 4 protein [Ignavibacteria bacterium]
MQITAAKTSRGRSGQISSEKPARFNQPVPDTLFKHVVLIGNYPPRRCGIATFTSDVRDSIALASPHTRVDVIVIDDGDSYDYGSDVIGTIRQDCRQDYVDLARFLNEEDVDVVCLQHEFGIYGGVAGEYILDLLNTLKIPVVTTLHTVLKSPLPDQQRVLGALLRRSSHAVVMANIGRDILVKYHNANAERIVVIPHGAPDRPLAPTVDYKRKLGLDGRDVLLTFGLLSPSKGLESVIRALPSICNRHHNAVYVIAGATHPNLVRREGQAYREHLHQLADELGIASHVIFVNDFLNKDDLLDYVDAADVYLTPYLNEEQVSSGTLAYAVAMGKPVVSTPYWHAVELLADDVGIIVDFNDSYTIAHTVSSLLSNKDELQAYRKRAYERGRETTWPRIGRRYVNVLEKAVQVHRQAQPIIVSHIRVHKPNIKALIAMTDDVGLYQHANKIVPDRAQGYCLDDNARALLLMQKFRSQGFSHPAIDGLELTYASFVNHAWNGSTLRFRNFMGFDRHWRDTLGSDDSNGRAIWCLGEVANSINSEHLRSWAIETAHNALQVFTSSSPRTTAFIVLGARGLIAADPKNHIFREALEKNARRLFEWFQYEKRLAWPWCEPYLAYDNARLPQALIEAGIHLSYKTMIATGLDALEWLVSMQTSPEGLFCPVGTESFGAKFTTPALFDQQPLEAAATVDACLSAFNATQDPKWVDEMYRAYAWFFGSNISHALMIAEDSGGCFDGICKSGINHNQGAESILSFQLANLSMSSLHD